MRLFLAVLMTGVLMSMHAAEAASREYTFCIKTNNGHNYIMAQSNKSLLLASSTQCKDWELHTLIDLNGGFLMHGDKVAFKTHWGRYWTAQQNGTITADATQLGEWQTFTMLKNLPSEKPKISAEERRRLNLPSDPLKNSVAERRRLLGIGPGSKVGFKGYHGTWVRTQQEGGGDVDVYGLKLEPSTTFQLVTSEMAAAPVCNPSCADQYKECNRSAVATGAFNQSNSNLMHSMMKKCDEALVTCKKNCNQ